MGSARGSALAAAAWEEPSELERSSLPRAAPSFPAFLAGRRPAAHGRPRALVVAESTCVLSSQEDQEAGVRQLQPAEHRQPLRVPCGKQDQGGNGGFPREVLAEGSGGVCVRPECRVHLNKRVESVCHQVVCVRVSEGVILLMVPCPLPRAQARGCHRSSWGRRVAGWAPPGESPGVEGLCWDRRGLRR